MLSVNTENIGKVDTDIGSSFYRNDDAVRELDRPNLDSRGLKGLLSSVINKIEAQESKRADGLIDNLSATGALSRSAADLFGTQPASLNSLSDDVIVGPDVFLEADTAGESQISLKDFPETLKIYETVVSPIMGDRGGLSVAHPLSPNLSVGILVEPGKPVTGQLHFSANDRNISLDAKIDTFGNMRGHIGATIGSDSLSVSSKLQIDTAASPQLQFSATAQASLGNINLSGEVNFEKKNNWSIKAELKSDL
jgi:hypothetical protein